MITIVNYGLGNLGSIQNMLKRLGFASLVSGDPAIISEARKLILPGVGSFDHAMKCIATSGLQEALNHKVVEEKVPLLGICLGMQLLTQGSEEGRLSGLGWLKASTKRLKVGNLKVPHMGWNSVQPAGESPLTKNLPEDSRFYFVHSYHVVPDDPADVLFTTTYGGPFASGVYNRANIFGVQFHPEKSHRFGLQLLRNFAEMPC